MIKGIASELELLRTLKGADYIKQLKVIAGRKEFHPLESDPYIFTVGGENDADYPNLLNAARKAVTRGNKVYILPNPIEFRTADYIFERKGIFKMYDLKTISGKSAVEGSLLDSIGQSNRILISLTIDYNPVVLARSIRKYFEHNADAVEVMIYKGKKSIITVREDLLSPNFIKQFVSRYLK